MLRLTKRQEREDARGALGIKVRGPSRRLGHGVRSLGILSIIVSLLAMTGCGNSNPNNSNSGAQTVRFAEVPGILETFLVHVADEKGYMAQNNIHMSYVSVKSGPDLVAALIGGNADVGLAAPSLYWPAIDKGEKIISLTGTIKYNYVLGTCGPDTPTPHIADKFPANLQDLKGKRVGVIGPGTATEGFAKALLKAAGLTEGKDVTLVNLGAPSTAIPACQANRADFYTFPPPAQALLPGTKIVADALNSSTGDLFSKLVVTVYATNGQYAQNHGSTLTGFCNALVEAKKFVTDPANQQAAVKLLAQHTGITEDAAAKVWPEQKSALLPPLTKEVWDAQAAAVTASSKVPAYDTYVSSQCTDTVSK